MVKITANSFKGKTASSKPKADIPKVKQHEKFNLIQVKALYDKTNNDWYCEIDDIKYPLVWDNRNIRFVVLYSLPVNDKHDAWTGVEFDIKGHTPEQMDKILQHWSPIKPNQFVYVIIHDNLAIITKQK